ncbi:hypothetical protein E8E14_006342 [Neopestalotiopsis sp. 37M]|nr:hypothetical protein E8E14_006342 [Neopestalotiopsis sp. 37M]
MKFAITAVLSGLLVSGATANFFTLSYSESTGYCSVVLTDVCSCTEKVEFYKKGTCRSREAGWTRVVPNGSDACYGSKITVTDDGDGFHIDYNSGDNLCEIGCTTSGKLSGDGC